VDCDALEGVTFVWELSRPARRALDGGALFIEKHRSDTRTVIAPIKLYTGRRPLGGVRAMAPGDRRSGATVWCLLTGWPASGPLTEDTMTQQTGESYPKLRQVLGDDGFAELAQLIRTTYEANEARRRRPARRGRVQPSPGA
jgi:hypothetical protein